MNKPFYQNGLRFSCRQCSYCCRGEPGFVFLSLDDLQRLSASFSWTIQEIIQKYCHYVPVNGRHLISLKEKPDNDCIFLEHDTCRVYAARPVQCQTYPFWPSILRSEKVWKNEADHCPGINSGRLYKKTEIDRRLQMRQHNILLTAEELEGGIRG
ncbi:MAG: YkgJ family cysteine cluster protein [Spirochaetales bacterium]|nr:YkgJ family cysteine cluster protein [Spirochaetales bacterium]